jgi:alpha-galactosidase
MKMRGLGALVALFCVGRPISQPAYGATETEFPDITPARHWSADRAPFSFKLDGRDSARFLGSWQFSEEEGRDSGGAPVHRYVYLDPATRLRVTAEVRTFPDYPGAVDWVLWFRNDGPNDSPIIEDILPLRWSAPSAGCTVHHARGSDAKPDDYEPLEERLAPGGFDHIESRNGRSSDTNSLPFFNLQSGDHGVIGAIGWTGNWKADFSVGNGPDPRISVSAGMKRTHLLLHPGEEIRTPRIVLLNWSGADWQASQNLWRRLVLAHYSPQENGQPMRGCLIYGAGDNIGEMLALVKWIHEHQFPLDYFAVDAGWYGNRFKGTDKDTFWWMNRGNWFPNPRFCPDGMRPLGQALKDDGIGFSLWIEPETAMPGTKIVTEHPDWFLHSRHPVNPGVMLANLGEPVVRKALTDMVYGFITDYEMTWYRQDFNIPPEEYWARADTPDRVGMAEIMHIEGL